MSRVVAIIQARSGSTRLPHKIFADIAGETMLGRTVRRAQRANTVDEVIVATTDNALDDRVVEESDRLGVRAIRGSEADVLDRYHQAASASDAEIIVRVTSDCPLIDPAVIDLVVRRFCEAPGAAYCSNVLKRTFPRGLDVEAIDRGALDAAAAESSLPHQREHVTPYLYEQPNRFSLRSVECAEDFSAYRWTVDEIDDLRLVREIYDAFAPNDMFGWEEVIQLMRLRPELAAWNAHVAQKPLIQYGR
jgi:spore coat polysaccharide biosynthesis protein SpsF